MSKRKMYSLSYFLGRAFFLGFGYSLLLSLTDKDAWICFILGTLLGIIPIYFLSKIKENMKGQSLKEYLNQNKFFKIAILLLFFLLNFFILSQSLFILETFASSFFLIKSPPYFILLPIIYLLYRMTKKSWSTIGRVGEILMPFSLVIVLITSMILIPYADTTNFLPVMTHSNKDMIMGTLFYAFYSSAPFLLLLNTPMKDTKLCRKYLFSSATILLIGVLIIAVLGPNLIQIYRYPEYMLLKKIKVFEFLEKIENIISVTWIIDLFMIEAISANNIKDTIPKKKNNMYFISILLILYFGVIYLGKIYQIELQVYHILPTILGIFEIVILLSFFFYQIYTKKKNSNN